MERLLTTVEGWKETNPALVCQFVTYATKITLSEHERITLGVFFRRSGEESDIHRYEFVCQQ